MMTSRFSVAFAFVIVAGCSPSADDASVGASSGAGASSSVSTGSDAAAEAWLTERIGAPDYASCLRSGVVETVTAEGGDVGAPEGPLRRLVVAVDSSGSMAGRLGSETKMALARDAAMRFLTTVPADVEVGLVAFGHRGNNRESGKAASCAGVEALYPVGRATRADVAAAVDRMRPVGWTPLAGGLSKAGDMLVPVEKAGEQVVYIVSDGVETCGGDPTAAARALNTGAKRAVVNVIGFDLPTEDERQLRAVAEAGGGSFRNLRGANAAAEIRAEAARAAAEVRAKARSASAQTGNSARTASANVASSTCMASRQIREGGEVARMIRQDTSINPVFANRITAALTRRHRDADTALKARVEANDARRDEARARIDAETDRTPQTTR